MDRPGFWRFFLSRFRIFGGPVRLVKSVRDGREVYFKEVRKAVSVWYVIPIVILPACFIHMIPVFKNIVFDTLLAGFLLLVMLLSIRYFFIRFERIPQEEVPAVLEKYRKSRAGNAILAAFTILVLCFLLVNSFTALYIRSQLDQASGKGPQVSVSPGNGLVVSGSAQGPRTGSNDAGIVVMRSPDIPQVLLDGEMVPSPVYRDAYSFIWDPDYFKQQLYPALDVQFEYDKTYTLEVVCGDERQVWTVQRDERP